MAVPIGRGPGTGTPFSVPPIASRPIGSGSGSGTPLYVPPFVPPPANNFTPVGSGLPGVGPQMRFPEEPVSFGHGQGSGSRLRFPEEPVSFGNGAGSGPPMRFPETPNYTPIGSGQGSGTKLGFPPGEVRPPIDMRHPKPTPGPNPKPPKSDGSYDNPFKKYRRRRRGGTRYNTSVTPEMIRRAAVSRMQG